MFQKRIDGSMEITLQLKGSINPAKVHSYKIYNPWTSQTIHSQMAAVLMSNRLGGVKTVRQMAKEVGAPLV